jgi:hypothetical protein
VVIHPSVQGRHCTHRTQQFDGLFCLLVIQRVWDNEVPSTVCLLSLHRTARDVSAAEDTETRICDQAVSIVLSSCATSCASSESSTVTSSSYRA